jgi:PAS domain S-box-containing protein
MPTPARHILIVDDTPTNRKLLGAILEGEGYTTTAAADGEEALHLLASMTADAIISDILMPRMDGFRFCYEVRKSERHALTPFLFLTATYTSGADERLALDLGADRLLQRPAPSAAILQAVRDLLTNPVYREPRTVHQPKTVEMIRGYSEALMAKLEEKNTELQASEEQFRAITETADDLIAVIDLDGTRLYASPSYRRVLGDPDRLRGTDSFQEIHPDDRERIRGVFRATVATGSGRRTEFRLVLPDGSVRHMESQGSVIRDAAGNPRRVVVVSRDISERKKTEDTLRKLSSAVEQAGDSVVITNRDGVIEYVNPAFERSTGFQRDEVLGKTPRLLKSGRHAREFYRGIWDTILARSVFRGEIVNRRRNGELYVEHQTISPVLDEQGNIVHFVSAGRDTTEQKEAEEHLRLSEQKYKTLFEAVPAGLLQATEDGSIVTANPALADLLGYPSAESVVGRHLTRDLSLDPREGEELLDSFRAGGRARSLEVRWKRRDGSPVWVHLHLSRAQQSRDRAPFFEAFAVDITSRKRAEEARIHSERRYRTLFEEATDGLFICSADGRLVDVNPAVARIFGCSSKEEVLRLDFLRALDRTQDGEEPLLGRLMREDAVDDVAAVATRSDGRPLHLLVSLSAVRDPDGSVEMVRGLLRDVTRQRQLEEQLAQARRLESLGTLAGGVAHDFNNILAIILGQADLLERAPGDLERVHRSMSIITKAALRGMTLIQQLLTFARKKEVTLEPVVVNELVREFVALVGETFPRIVTLRTALEDGLPLLVADASQLHQVLLNLCVNARDALVPAGGEITIATTCVPGASLQGRFAAADVAEYVRLTVSDTGSGMDEATRRRIFEPFFTTKEKGHGTGLGLATVYGIVEGHGGFIDVDSEVGRGTTFSLYFPVLAPTAPVPPAAGEESAEEIPAPGTVLVVEDEEMLLEYVEEVLMEEGYAVFTARDGEEGVRTFAENHLRIDAVLTDLGLPKLSGDRLIGALLGIDPGARIVVASGSLEPDLKHLLREAGARDFLQKPFRPHELLAVLRRTIQARAR